MPRQHTRLALREVTFEGLVLPGATLDRWQDDHGRTQWSVRVVTRSPTLPGEAGELLGRTPDGRIVRGQVVVAERQLAEGGRRETLIAFHGSGELTVVLEEPTPAQ